MNQDQIKKHLQSIRPVKADFTVILSGKKSNKVNGLYKPESREIILHNKNFKNDDELLYTAIHEYAHHIQFTTAAAPISVRTHTVAFWNILHTLLFEAEEKGLYKNPFDSSADFRALTAEIKEKVIKVSGGLMKELGKLLIKAHELCEKHGANFTDYVDRTLGLPRVSAHAVMRAETYDLDPRVGSENMRSLAGIRDEGERSRAQEALISGKTPDMVKAVLSEKKKPGSARKLLEEERTRLERTIERLKARMKAIEKKIEELEED